MTEPEASTDRLEGAKAPKKAKVWLDRLQEYQEKFSQWQDKCKNVGKLYAKTRSDNADREYSLFWANVEILKEASYARTPVPVVAPKFKDGNAVVREASETLERNLVTSFESGDVDGLMREVRDDMLMFGRGTAWIRLAGEDDELALDHIDHRDFAHELARRWREVTWVARRSWVTREQAEKRFGEIGKQIELKKRDENAAVPDRADKGPIWEIWSQADNCVYWVSPGVADVLDHKPALYDLQTFWPCPKPAYGTVEPGSLLPVPEFVQYKDQVEEINEYTARIAAISEQLRLKGFYPSGMGDLSEAIETALKSVENRAVLIPVASAAALGGGDFSKSVVWLPIVDAANLVKTLVELRRAIIEDVYQITGISDIVRGATDPNETKGAQQLKSQWGSLRIRGRQNSLVFFARDIARIAGEIIAENFPPEVIFERAQSQLPTMAAKQQAQSQLQQMQAQAQQAAMMAQQSGQPAPPPPQPPKELTKLLKQPTQEEVAEFLKNDRARSCTIEIETDSTIQPDEDAEKQRRVEFLGMAGQFLGNAVPMVQQFPAAGTLLVEMIKFGAQAFRAARPLEAAIEQFGEMIEGMMEQGPAQPPVDPVAQAKAEATIRAQKLAEKRFTELEVPVAQAEGQRKDKELKLKQDEFSIRQNEDARAVVADHRAGELHGHDLDDRVHARLHADKTHNHAVKVHDDTMSDGKAARREKFQADGLLVARDAEGGEELVTPEEGRHDEIRGALSGLTDMMRQSLEAATALHSAIKAPRKRTLKRPGKPDLVATDEVADGNA